MKPIELFVTYCKIRGIMPLIKKIENFSYCYVFQWDDERSCYRKSPLFFKDFLNGNIRYNGLQYMFRIFENTFCQNKEFQCDEKYKLAKRRWNTFLRDNIKIKEGIKPGDKVVFRTYSGEEEEAEFISFIDNYREIRVKLDNGTIASYLTRNLKKVNGKDFEYEFYIRWKSKNYGID